LKRAAELRVIEALDDRPRAGRDPTITAEAKTWLVALACRKAKELGYPHVLWTTRLLAKHAQDHGPTAGHPSLAKLAQGTVCKILADQEVKPHKVSYYLEKRDPEFEPKMAEILCVYRQVALLRERGESAANVDEGSLAVISYDEKPGIQAIGTTAPDRPPRPGTSPTVMRDHEYKRHSLPPRRRAKAGGTLTLMAGIDLLTGQVHALVRERHRSREFIEFLKLLDTAYPADTAIEIVLDNHSAHVSRETTAWLAAQPIGRFTFTFTFTPTHGSCSI
jgi:transposase